MSGDLFSGEGEVWDDSVALSALARVVPQTQALLLDPATRDFPQDAQGFYVGLHPVDARVEVQLITTLGAIPAASDIGTALPTYKFVTPDLRVKVTNEVRRALAPEIKGKNIELKSITVETVEAGGFFVEVVYVNLRIPAAARQDRPVKVPLRGANPNPSQ